MLALEIIRCIYRLRVDGTIGQGNKYKVEEGTNQQLAKDMWLLSYYCIGINIKDIINIIFSNIKNDTLYYERLKTLTTNQISFVQIHQAPSSFDNRFP